MLLGKRRLGNNSVRHFASPVPSVTDNTTSFISRFDMEIHASVSCMCTSRKLRNTTAHHGRIQVSVSETGDPDTPRDTAISDPRLCQWPDHSDARVLGRRMHHCRCLAMILLANGACENNVLPKREQ